MATAAAAGARELGTQLARWMRHDLLYAPARGPVPTAADFAKLCRGNMIPVWQFLMTRVVTERTAKEIRGNLALHQQTQRLQKQNDEVEDLLAREAELRTEVEELEAQVRKTAEELREETLLLRQQESDESTMVAEIDEAQEQLALLKALLKMAVFHCELFAEYTKKLEGHMTDCSRTTNETAIATLQGRISDCVKEIATALPAERVSAAPHPDQPQLADALLLKKFQENGAELLRCLVDLCDKRVAEIANDTSEVAVAARVAEQQQQQQALNALFDKLRSDHLARYAAVEEVLQHAEDLELEWKRVWSKMTIDDTEKQTYVIPLIRTLQTKELELKALEAMLENLNELAAHLSQMRGKKQKSNVQAAERLKQIQQLDTVISSRRELLKQLVQNNHTFRLGFKQQLEGVIRLANEISPLQNELSVFHLKLQDVISQETNCGSHFPLAAVAEPLLVDGKLMLTAEPVAQQMQHEELAGLRTALNVQLYEAETRTLPLLIDAKSIIEAHTAADAALKDALLSKAKNDTKMSQLMGFQELIREHAAQEAEALGGLVPALAGQTEQTAQAVERCKDTARLLDEWWTQPAQFAAPWLLLDSMNMQQIVATVRGHFASLK